MDEFFPFSEHVEPARVNHSLLDPSFHGSSQLDPSLLDASHQDLSFGLGNTQPDLDFIDYGTEQPQQITDTTGITDTAGTTASNTTIFTLIYTHDFLGNTDHQIPIWGTPVAIHAFQSTLSNNSIIRQTTGCGPLSAYEPLSTSLQYLFPTLSRFTSLRALYNLHQSQHFLDHAGTLSSTEDDAWRSLSQTSDSRPGPWDRSTLTIFGARALLSLISNVLAQKCCEQIALQLGVVTLDKTSGFHFATTWEDYDEVTHTVWLYSKVAEADVPGLQDGLYGFSASHPAATSGTISNGGAEHMDIDTASSSSEHHNTSRQRSRPLASQFATLHTPLPLAMPPHTILHQHPDKLHYANILRVALFFTNKEIQTQINAHRVSQGKAAFSVASTTTKRITSALEDLAARFDIPVRVARWVFDEQRRKSGICTKRGGGDIGEEELGQWADGIEGAVGSLGVQVDI